MSTYQRLPLQITRGKGCWVWDNKGNKYLDAVAGIATCSLGHSNIALRRALTRQLNQIQHVSNLYQIAEQEELAHWLVQHSCADKVFFCNSGAEANEAAIKLARKYAHSKRGINLPIILTAKGSFHGRTLAAVSATGQPKYHKGFEPVVQGFEFFDYNQTSSLNELINRLEANSPSIAAVLIEPIQGEGGINTGEINFFKALKETCEKYRILLIFDEVQTGMGRTGHWWGYQHLGVEPDAITIAKGLGGGHAIGGLLVKDHADVLEPGDHASTFGGNPFACKAALTVAQQIETRNLLCKVRERGLQLKTGLLKLVESFPSLLTGTRGLGLMQGLVINEKSNLSSQTFVQSALSQKLLLIGAGPKVIRLVPSLVINDREVRLLLKKLEATFKRHE